MFNIFKSNSKKTNVSTNTQEALVLQETQKNEQNNSENKKNHGEDDVCCGGCGGQ